MSAPHFRMVWTNIHTCIFHVCFVSMDNVWQMVQQCACEIYMYVCTHTDVCVCFFFPIFSLPLSLTNMHAQYIINNYGLYLVHIRLFIELSFQFFYMFERKGWGESPRRWGIPAVGCAKIVIFLPVSISSSSFIFFLSNRILSLFGVASCLPTFLWIWVWPWDYVLASEI